MSTTYTSYVLGLPHLVGWEIEQRMDALRKPDDGRWNAAIEAVKTATHLGYFRRDDLRGILTSIAMKGADKDALWAASIALGLHPNIDAQPQCDALTRLELDPD